MHYRHQAPQLTQKISVVLASFQFIPKNESRISILKIRPCICSISTVILCDCTHTRPTAQVYVSPSVSCRWQTHHSRRRCVCRSDLRAAQTKNTTGHDGVTFKTSGTRCLELDLLCLLWIIVIKFNIIFINIIIIIIINDSRPLVGWHKAHFKLNKQAKHANTFY